MRLTQLAAIVCVCVASCQAAQTKFPTVCSAFDGPGDEATATISEGKFMLRVSPASGAELISFSASSGNNGYIRCSIFFDKDALHIAVGMNPIGSNQGPLDIFVGDLATKKLTGSFSVHPGEGLGESLALVGFLRDSSSLVVLGSGARSHPTKSFSVTLFRVTGEQESSPETRALPENTGSVGNVSWVDATHNRLWLKSKTYHCPLRSIPLVGSGPEGAKVDESEAGAACDADIAIAYPDDDTIITALTRGDTDPVTEIDLLKHKAQQTDLLLPRWRYTSVDGGALSPDGKFFAVSRELLSLSFFGGNEIFHGTDVDIVQVSPLKFVGKFHLEPTADSQSISIDHQNGAVAMLSFDFKSGIWKIARMKVQ